jgi:hypothetical protein
MTGMGSRYEELDVSKSSLLCLRREILSAACNIDAMGFGAQAVQHTGGRSTGDPTWSAPPVFPSLLRAPPLTPKP